MGLEDLLYRGWNKFALPKIAGMAVGRRNPILETMGQPGGVRNSGGYNEEVTFVPPQPPIPTEVQDIYPIPEETQDIYPIPEEEFNIPRFQDPNVPTEVIDVPRPPLRNSLMQTENIDVPRAPLQNGLMQTENIDVPSPFEPPAKPYEVPTEVTDIYPVPEEVTDIPPFVDPDVSLMQKVAQPTPPKPKTQPRLSALPSVEPPIPPTPEIPVEEITVPAPEDVPEAIPTPGQPVEAAPEMGNLSPIERYQQLLGRTPRREDYGLSKKDKILAAVAGGLMGARDPFRAVGAVRELMDRPYNEAAAAHQQQLENTGREVQLDVLQQSPEIQRQKIREKALADAENLRQKYAALQQKAEAARLVYEAKMAAAKTAEEKNIIEREWHQAQIGLQSERLDISRSALGIQQQLADTRARGTAAYELSVKQQPEVARIRSGGSAGRLPSVMEQTRASNAAIQTVLAAHPEWSDFLRLAPPGGQDTLASQEGWFDNEDVPPEAIKAVEDATAAILRRSYPGYGVK